MQKEIHEQPTAVRRLIGSRLDGETSTVRLDEIAIEPERAQSFHRVKLLGCGSAYYAGLAGTQLMERLAGIPADASAASAFRYSKTLIDPDTLYIAISK